MPIEMVRCPHCGTANSAKKQLCYECQRELRAPTDTAVPARALRPRAADPAAHLPPVSALAAAQRGKAPEAALLAARHGAALAERAAIYRALEMQLRAGVPLGQALAMLEARAAVRLVPALHDLGARVQAGGRLSEGMADYPVIFPAWEIAVLGAAETTGDLAAGTASIADDIEEEMWLRSRVAASTWYLQAVGLLLILVAMLCATAKTEIPALARAGVAMWPAILTYLLCWLLPRFLGYVILPIVALRIGWRQWMRTPRGAAIGQGILRHLPLIGPLLRLRLRRHFTQVLGALWQAGVRPLDALVTAARVTGRRQVEEAVARELQRLSHGTRFSDVLVQTGMFTEEDLALIRTGEVSGTVGQVLGQISAYQAEQLRLQSKHLPLRCLLVLFVIVVPPLTALLAYQWRDFYETVLGRLMQYWGQSW